MFVEQAMSSPAITIDPSAGVARAWLLMHERRIRHLPVIEAGRLVGIISDRDAQAALARQTASGGGHSLEALAWIGSAPSHPESRPTQPGASTFETVGTVMRRNVLTVEPSTPIEEASRMMSEHKIGALPVVDEARVVGMVSESDVLRTLWRILGVSEPSTRVQLELDQPMSQLAAITVIADRLRIPISSLVTEPKDHGHTRTVVLRLDTIDPEPFVREVRGLGIHVDGPER